MSDRISDSKRIRRLTRVLLSSAAFAAGIGTQALAQQAGTEEVTVTAQRREQNILDVPYNITAVSGDRIDMLQIRDNAELFRSVPGVAIVDRGERNGSVVNGIRIRGLNVDSAALGDYSVSSAATVATYVNDTPIFANFMLKDIERVEVLKGPQGTLYGSGALGGAVRYIMRKPDFEAFSGSATVTVSYVNGSDNVGWAEDIVLNVPLAETLALRVSGTRFDYPGLTDYVNVYRRQNNIPVIGPGGIFSTDTEFRNVEDADDFDGWYGRAVLLWKPSATFDVTLTYMHQSDDYGGRRAQTLGVDGFGRPYKDHESGSMILEPGSRTVDLLAAEVNVDLGFATLTSSTSWYDHHGDLISDNTGFYAQNGWLFNFYYNYPRPLAEADRTYGYEAWIQEVRLVSKSEGPWHYVLGAFYSNEEQFGTQDSFLRGFKNWADATGFLGPFVISDRDYHYIRDEEFTEYAAYGELTYDISDRLSVTGGLRVFNNQSDTHVFQITGLYTFFNETSDSRGSDEASRVLFKGNVAWKFSDDDLLYATIAQGYRRGGSNGTPTTGFFAESPAFLTYKSDDVTDYEIGVKGRLGENIIYNADIFYVDWQDPQFNTATTFFGFFAVANGEHATTKGIEAQIDGYAGNWHWGVGYTYTDATLEEDLFTADGLILINTAGATLPGAPKHMMNGVLEYNWPFEDGSSLFLHVDGYYQSSTLNTISSSTSSLNSVCLFFGPVCTPGPYFGQPRFYAKFDSFALFNASATYNRDAWTATVFVKNIFNEAGITGEYTEAYMGTYPAQNYVGNASKEIFALPRTLGLTVSYKF